MQAGHAWLLARAGFRPQSEALQVLLDRVAISRSLRGRLPRGPLPQALCSAVQGAAGVHPPLAAQDAESSIRPSRALPSAHRRKVEPRDLPPQNVNRVKLDSLVWSV